MIIHSGKEFIDLIGELGVKYVISWIDMSKKDKLNILNIEYKIKHNRKIHIYYDNVKEVELALIYNKSTENKIIEEIMKIYKVMPAWVMDKEEWIKMEKIRGIIE